MPIKQPNKYICAACRKEFYTNEVLDTIAKRYCTDCKCDSKDASAFNKQVGGSYYKNYKIQPYEFFFKNKITHEKAAIIRRILRYDAPDGKGLEDLEKIKHECDLLIELNGFSSTEAYSVEYKVKYE